MITYKFITQDKSQDIEAMSLKKAMKKKLRSEFSGLKFKNRGDGMTEISFD